MPRHLTATELAANLAIYGGIGWWLGGGRGSACGLGLLAILYGLAILRALPAASSAVAMPPPESPPGDPR